MARTNIEWTEISWNPITGCTKISDGCKNCYAEKMALRLKAMGHPNYKNGFSVEFHKNMLDRPYTWKTGHLIFVNSMSDLFHEEVPLETIQLIVEVMRETHWHQYQILTKRSSRMKELSKTIIWPDNVWLGVSVESSKYISRIDDLRQININTRFISFEPLIGDIHNFNTDGIDWIIVGGESGPSSRPIKKEWVTNIRDICIKKNIPFFFKQWGGVNKKKNGKTLEGKIWQQIPRTSQVIHNSSASL